MRIQLLSDLHLESDPDWQAAAVPGADLLVLAGDVGSYQAGSRLGGDDFGLARFSPLRGGPWARVVYLPGNHEYDDLPLDETRDRLRRLCEELGLIWLDREVREIDGVRFIGCTLWTDFEALAAAGREGKDVDGVLCAAANMQRAYPAMAVEIQQALGAGGYGFDMNVACSSATFGIEQAVNAIKAGTARRVLMVNPEITSAHLEWRDRDCHFIFGDVCTAVVVEAADTATSADQWEVLGTRLATKFSNNIRNNFGFMNAAEDSDPDARDKKFRQEGRKVFKEVVPMAAAHIEAHLQQLGFRPEAVRRRCFRKAPQPSISPRSWARVRT